MLSWYIDTAADGKTEFHTSTNGGVCDSFGPFAVMCGAMCGVRYVWLPFFVLA
jgi:hypothetical protein